MATVSGTTLVAPLASTGNNSHAGFATDPDLKALAIEFVVEAIGATPTVTFVLQGSEDDPQSVTDANATWYNLNLADPSGAADAASVVSTVVGRVLKFAKIGVSGGGRAFYKRYRVVSSLNTNVTYHVNAIQLIDTDSN